MRQSRSNSGTRIRKRLDFVIWASCRRKSARLVRCSKTFDKTTISNGLLSEYCKISPTIKVGKWIQKGYVVGRVNGTLQFQATKNKKYIDPVKLFQ